MADEFFAAGPEDGDELDGDLDINDLLGMGLDVTEEDLETTPDDFGSGDAEHFPLTDYSEEDLQANREVHENPTQ